LLPVKDQAFGISDSRDSLDGALLEPHLAAGAQHHHCPYRVPQRDRGEQATDVLQRPYPSALKRILLAAVRVGQHVFAQQVLANCGSRCVFCGLRPTAFGAKRMLMAGHIKPWKDSTSSERLDPRNGLAACPAHDVAFDTGMLMVNGGLRIHLARPLAEAVQTDPLARQYYGQPPLREVLLLPDDAQTPATRYLDWHRRNVFVS